jgi:hypothetical protein
MAGRGHLGLGRHKWNQGPVLGSSGNDGEEINDRQAICTLVIHLTRKNLATSCFAGMASYASTTDGRRLCWIK